MVARFLAALTSGATRQVVKASDVRSRTASPKAPALSSMVESTRATANITLSILFIICPLFPVPLKDFIVEEGSDNFGTAARLSGRAGGR